MIKEVIDGTEQYVLLEGNALDTLKQVPSGVVQCCITSPPYFGLRSYGTAPQLWGGDANCDHVWEVTKPRRTRSEKDVKNPNTIQNANKGANCNLLEAKKCTKCKGWYGELGGEPTPEMFIENLVSIFAEVWRVLRNDGVLFVNLGDSYFKKESWNKHDILKDTDMCLIPHHFAIAMQKAGWYVRGEIIWDKRNMCMPESVTTRCTRAHETIWHFTKSRKYFWDDFAVRDYVDGGDIYGANKRDVWTLKPTKFDGEHYAGFPMQLPEFCLKVATSEKGKCSKCGSPYTRIVERISKERYDLDPSDVRYRPKRYDTKYDLIKDNESNGMRFCQIIDKGWQPSCQCGSNAIPCVVLDPFSGAGTTGIAAFKNGRNYIGCELNPEYIALTEKRFLGGEAPLLELYDECM